MEINGLLSRTGEFYSCAFGGHTQLVLELAAQGIIDVGFSGLKTETEIERALSDFDSCVDTEYPIDNGWVKIQYNQLYINNSWRSTKTWGLTQEQVNWIYQNLPKPYLLDGEVVSNDLPVETTWFLHDYKTYCEKQYVGNKASQLLLLNQFISDVPKFVIIPNWICQKILNKEINGLPTHIVERIIKYVGDKFSVRSSPVKSMPGMMSTYLDSSDLNTHLIKTIDSWNSPRCTSFRTATGLSHDFQGGVIIQKQVYGDFDETSGSGVIKTRYIGKNQHQIQGDYLPQQKGDLIANGSENTLDINQVDFLKPGLYNVVQRIYKFISKRPQEIEFTVESGRLFILQTRDYQWRSVNTELILTEDLTKSNCIKAGRTGSPGIVTGSISYDISLFKLYDSVIYCALETAPDDVDEILAADGVLTARGGSMSHAAIIANHFNKPALVGTGFQMISGEAVFENKTLKEGQVITIDCNNCCLFV